MTELQCVAVLRRLIEDVSFASDVTVQRHYQSLADRIDRRIGDLREGLLEIAEQELRLVRQTGQRCVDAHRSDRFLAHQRRRRQNCLQVFVGVAEGALPHQDRLVIGRLHMRGARQMIESDLIVLQPFRIGLAGSELLFYLFIRNQSFLFHINQQHPARRKPALHANVFWFDGKHSCFRGHHDQTVRRDQEAAGAESIAIEFCADHAAIGECHGSRAIPRLHQRSVVFVKRFDVLRHGSVMIPGFRDQHGHDVRERSPGKRQQLDRIVEHRGVAAACRNNGQQFLDVSAKQRRRQDGLPRVHPIHISAQGVDFTVVANVAIGVSQLPARESICREALMNQTQTTGQLGIKKIFVKIRNLRRKEQTLVHDRARGKRRYIEKFLLLQIAFVHDRFRPLAHYI